MKILTALFLIIAVLVYPTTRVLAVFNSSFGIGSRGSQVQELQQTLTKLGFYNGPITGYFGFLTRAAVSKFQKTYNISPPLGYFGFLTRSKLNQLLSQIKASSPLKQSQESILSLPISITPAPGLKKSWAVVFVSYGIALQTSTVDLLCGSLDHRYLSYVAVWFRAEAKKYTPDFDLSFNCFRSQISIPLDLQYNNLLTTYSDEAITPPLKSDQRIVAFLEDKTPELKAYDFVSVVYIVPPTLQISHHNIGKYSFVFMRESPEYYQNPQSYPDAYSISEPIAHELAHALGARDKYSSGTQGCLINPTTQQEYDGRDIMCHRVKAESLFPGLEIARGSFITPSLDQLFVSPATAKEFGWR